MRLIWMAAVIVAIPPALAEDVAPCQDPQVLANCATERATTHLTGDRGQIVVIHWSGVEYGVESAPERIYDILNFDLGAEISGNFRICTYWRNPRAYHSPQACIEKASDITVALPDEYTKQPKK